ncbi:MAG TPA: hypothetical protein PKD05_19690 [Candidatus Melainabacteria bacterium]|nr:hypothetical protein [Candidatus Melainabacteria bacterium]
MSRSAITLKISALLIFLLGLFSGQSFAADALLKGDSQRVRVNKLLGNIHWHQSLAQAQADARSRNKMIFWVNILGRLDRDT